jgi:hypothetical protein
MSCREEGTSFDCGGVEGDVKEWEAGGGEGCVCGDEILQ